jgi:hypothetical protein
MKGCKYILIAGTIKPHYCNEPLFAGDFCNKHFLKDRGEEVIETCIYENVRGSYTGLTCGIRVFKDSYCKKHYERIEIKKKCKRYIIGKGRCNRKITVDGKKYCIRHLLNFDMNLYIIPNVE